MKNDFLTAWSFDRVVEWTPWLGSLPEGPEVLRRWVTSLAFAGQQRGADYASGWRAVLVSRLPDRSSS